MKQTDANNEKEIANSITAMLKDISNIQGFITQEIIKNIEANDGQIFSVEEPSFKEQIDSLLNADPRSEGNQGKAVLSFKATEVGIEEKLVSLQKKGASLDQLKAVRDSLSKAREEFAKKLSTNEGLHGLISNRVSSQLLLNSANFMIIDEKTKEERFLRVEEKQNLVETLKKQITLSPNLLETLLNPKKNDEKELIQKAVRRRVEESFSSTEKSKTTLPLLDVSQLQNQSTLVSFSQSINFDLQTRDMVITSSASLTTYQEFGKAIATNINAIYKNGSLKTLQDAFKDGGEMHTALNTLAEKERKVKEAQRSLEEVKVTNDNLAIKQELLNGATKELEAIHSLQTRLNQLSSNIGAATGNLAGRKAINEFEYSVQQNKEVKQSFFGALVSTIYNSFSRKDAAKLDAAKLTLNAVSTKIINDNPKSSSLEELVKPQTIQKPTYDPALPNSKTNQPPPPNFSPPPPPNKKFQQEADQVVNVLRPIDQQNLGQETEEKTKPKLSYAEKVGKKEKPVKASRDDLLNDIKNPSERLKPISKDLDMNSGGFTYIPEIGSTKQDDSLSSALQKRRGAIDPEDQINSLMEGKGEKAQLNVLYSAVINGSKALIQGIIEHGSGKIFTKENCQKLYDAASGVKEKSGSNKKVIIEKGLRSLAKEVNLDIPKNTKLDR